MIRKVLSPRSTWATTTRRSFSDHPISSNRSSAIECPRSWYRRQKGSRNTDDASSKLTPCFCRLRAAFDLSHEKLGAIPNKTQTSADFPHHFHARVAASVTTASSQALSSIAPWLLAPNFFSVDFSRSRTIPTGRHYPQRFACFSSSNQFSTKTSLSDVAAPTALMNRKRLSSMLTSYCRWVVALE